MPAPSSFTPSQILALYPTALRAQQVIPAIDAAKTTLSSGAFSCPQFQKVANQANLQATIAYIFSTQSSFNPAIYAGQASNGPYPGSTAYNSPVFTQNFHACVQLGAPGIFPTQPPANSKSSCIPLFMASHAQGLSQCLGTYHLSNQGSTPFSAVPIAAGLIGPIYNPAFTVNGSNQGINSFYAGSNPYNGVINGYIAMFALMYQSVQSGQPYYSAWLPGNQGSPQAFHQGTMIPQGNALLGNPGAIPQSSGQGSGQSVTIPPPPGGSASGNGNPCG